MTFIPIQLDWCALCTLSGRIDSVLLQIGKYRKMIAKEEEKKQGKVDRK